LFINIINNRPKRPYFRYYLILYKFFKKKNSKIKEKITIPIKKYLLKRKDTLRCIIEHLTDDKNTNRLVAERLKIPSKFQNYDLSSDEDESEAEKWEV
jgi:hypothetical protein